MNHVVFILFIPGCFKTVYIRIEMMVVAKVVKYFRYCPFGTWFCFRVYLCRYLWEESLP